MNNKIKDCVRNTRGKDQIDRLCVKHGRVNDSNIHSMAQNSQTV